VTAAYERATSAFDRAQNESDVLSKEIAELDGRISVSSGHGIEDEYEEIRGRRQAAEARAVLFKHEIAALTQL